ncbi:unnamed protein product [Protopolystoma xenopodis]|uniref:Uncharacterized protein n=1 Tax=Protopolystoma xenopodis TaxID=117903 RepID=A0A448WF77_9PLAT|nr:unnamed protein product [Protopolystoma xenopodis]
MYKLLAHLFCLTSCPPSSHPIGINGCYRHIHFPPTSLVGITPPTLSYFSIRLSDCCMVSISRQTRLRYVFSLPETSLRAQMRWSTLIATQRCCVHMRVWVVDEHAIHGCFNHFVIIRLVVTIFFFYGVMALVYVLPAGLPDPREFAWTKVSS